MLGRTVDFHERKGMVVNLYLAFQAKPYRVQRSQHSYAALVMS